MQIIYHNPPKDDRDFKELSKKDKSLLSFLNFTELMEHYLAADFEDTVDTFYEDIREGNFTNEKNFQKK